MEKGSGQYGANEQEVPPSSPEVKMLGERVADAVPPMIKERLSNAIGNPGAVLGYIVNRAGFDDKEARKALKGSGIKCPDIRDYCGKLWQFWELYHDLDTKLPRGAVQRVSGKVAVVTGASSGIGFVVAKKLAAAGARVILVARTREKLEQTRDILEKAGGEAHVYPCDLSDLKAIDECRSEEHTSELQSLMRISYAVFCLKKKTK